MLFVSVIIKYTTVDKKMIQYLNHKYKENLSNCTWVLSQVNDLTLGGVMFRFRLLGLGWINLNLNLKFFLDTIFRWSLKFDWASSIIPKYFWEDVRVRLTLLKDNVGWAPFCVMTKYNSGAY